MAISKKKTATKTAPTTKSSALKITPASVPRRSKDVLARRNYDGTVAIMRLDDDEYFFTLDGIAAEFWLMVDGKATLEKITQKLVERYDPPRARFEKDVAKLLSDLHKEKLLLL